MTVRSRAFVYLASLALALGALAPLATAGAEALPAPFRAGGRAEWTPRISLVWPQDGAGHATRAAQSRAINVSVWPTNAVPCDLPPAGARSLWVARNNEPAEPVDVTARLQKRRDGNHLFPSLEYDAVPAELAGNPSDTYRIFYGFASNVWLHSGDARTVSPQPVTPAGLAEDAPRLVDARIQVVYPHDARGAAASVAKATFVNVAVDLFAHGTLLSVPLDYPGDAEITPTLYVAEGDGSLQWRKPGTLTPLVSATKTSYLVGDEEYPRWTFDDVPVKPGVSYSFVVYLRAAEGTVQTFPTVWTHATGGRTSLPKPRPPSYTSAEVATNRCAP
jgi:hypothetical protein